MQPADALRYVHPDYDAYKIKWEKYQNCYEAHDMYAYIYKHLRESDTMFQQRVKRGYYYNYVASIVDLYIAYMYHPPILRQHTANQAPYFAEIYNDADLAGTKWDSFMKSAATYAQICGHCLVLVDAPKAPPEGFQNEQERIDAGHRPYLTIFQANQLMDWELDKYGNFRWVKLRIVRPPDRDWQTQTDTETEYYLIWSREEWVEWALQGDQAHIIDHGPNPIGVVPIVVCRNVRAPRHKWFGLSTIRDISDINIAILNWSSLGDEEVFERCLNVLTMERGEGDAPAELSHHNVLEYDPGANPPQYISPGASPLQLIGTWIDRGIDQIFRLAKLGGSSGVQQMQAATSGIAYAFEFNETNQSLKDKAGSMEQAEIEIHKLLSMWRGEEFEGVIEYPKEFGVDDYMQELQLLSQARITLKSATAIRQMEKKVMEKMFAADSAQLRDQINEEIDSTDTAGIPPPMMNFQTGQPADSDEDDLNKPTTPPGGKPATPPSGGSKPQGPAAPEAKPAA